MKVRARKKGKDRVWFIDFTLDGQRVRRDLLGCRTRSDAQRTADLLFGNLVRRRQLGELAGPSQAEALLTLGALLARDRQREGIAERTRRSEREHAKPLFDVLGPDFRVATLTPDHVEQFKRVRRQAGCRSRTINFSLCLLRAALNRAVKARILSGLPARIETVPEDSPRPVRVLTVVELHKLLGECKHLPMGHPTDATRQKYTPSPGFHAAVALMGFAGLRPGEVYGLRWCDINMSDATLAVVSYKTRGQGARRDIIPMNSVVTVSLTDYRNSLPAPPSPDSLVLGVEPASRRPARNKGSSHRPGHVAGCLTLQDHRLGDRLKAAARRAGLADASNITPYCLRHSFATALLKQGATLHETARLMRHSPAMTLRVYGHADSAGMRAAASSLEQATPTPAPPPDTA